jgi:hypothetical protein
MTESLLGAVLGGEDEDKAESIEDPGTNTYPKSVHI